MWEIYVQGGVNPGEHVLFWDAFTQQPIHGKYVTDYGGGFEDQHEDITLDEFVTHIMRIKAPEGHRGHWE